MDWFSLNIDLNMAGMLIDGNPMEVEGKQDDQRVFLKKIVEDISCILVGCEIHINDSLVFDIIHRFQQIGGF